MKSIYRTIFKEKWSFYTVVTVFSLLLAIFQIGAIVYTNLFEMMYHIDADASINFLALQERAAPLGENGGVESITGTGHNLFTYPRLLLYHITGSAFAAYGIYNIIVACALVLLVVTILKKLGASDLVILLCLNILLCPYVANDMHTSNYLGYFHLLFTSSAYYDTRTAVELLIILNILNAEQNRLSIPLLAAAGVCVFSFGMSSGTYLLQTVLAPAIIYCIVRAIIKNDAKSLLSKPTYIAAAGIVILFAGKIFVKAVFGQSAIDSEITFINIQNLWTNICSVFYGYMHLMGALPQSAEPSVLSAKGAPYAVALVVFAISVTAFVFYIYKLAKKDEAALKFLPFFIVILFVFAVQCLVKSPFEHESGLRGDRYLLPVMISNIFITGYFINSLSDDRLFKKAGLVILSFCIAASTVFSYYNYGNHKTPYEVCKNIASETKKYGAPVVYGWGAEYTGPINTWCVAFNLRAIDHTKVYKSLNYSFNSISNGGDYGYFTDNAEWTGETLILSTANDFEKLPPYIKNFYTPVYDEPGSDLMLYFSEDANRFDLTSAVKNGKNTDFPYSEGIIISNGEINEHGAFVSNGEEGQCLFGRAAHLKSEAEGLVPSVEAGTYSLTVKYRLSERGKDDPVLLISADGREYSAKLPTDSESVTINDISVSENCEFNYSVTVSKDTIIEIESIIIASE